MKKKGCDIIFELWGTYIQYIYYTQYLHVNFQPGHAENPVQPDRCQQTHRSRQQVEEPGWDQFVKLLWETWVAGKRGGGGKKMFLLSKLYLFLLPYRVYVTTQPILVLITRGGGAIGGVDVWGCSKVFTSLICHLYGVSTPVLE